MSISLFEHRINPIEDLFDGDVCVVAKASSWATVIGCPPRVENPPRQMQQMATTHNQITISTQKHVVVHVLPCHIAHDGPSNVDAHFKPRVDPNNPSLCTASFRGRKLRGRNVAFPNQYSGVSTLIH